MMMIIDCIRFHFHSKPGIQSRAHGEEGAGTCDLGLGSVLSYHLSLKWELREVSTNNFSYTAVNFNFLGGFAS